MKTKIGYKALTVRIVRGRRGFRSWSAHSKKITYSYDEWVKRPKGCGPLAVFTTWELAHSFVAMNGSSYSDSAIVRCEYVPSKRKTLWRDDGHKFKNSLPWGTALAEKVKLINDGAEV